MAVPHPGERVPSIQVGPLGEICSRNLICTVTGQIPYARWKGVDLSRP